MSTYCDNFASLCAPRLKEERQRLAMSQADAGSACNVSREIWGRYEKGAAVPGGEVLFSFSRAGADIAYIITGRRTQTDTPAPSDETYCIAVEVVQEWQIEHGTFLPAEKFMRAAHLLAELAEGEPTQVKKHAAKVLRLAA